MQYQDLRKDSQLWAILQERARALAAQKTDVTMGQGEEILVFRLGDGRYSIPANAIREVHPLTTYTPLPSTPPFIIGLVNIRGRLLTALDVRPLLGIPHHPPGEQAYLFIININNTEIGMLADAIIEVRHSDAELSQAISTTTGRGVTWIRGIDQNLNVSIDPALLLEDPRIIVNNEAE